MVRLLTHQATTSIRRLSPSRAVQKGIYRFLNNNKVEEQILIDELCSRSAGLCLQRHILCIQDTTEMNFYAHKHRLKEDTGLGRLDGDKPTLGFKMHSTLLVDAYSSCVLGFSDVQLWHRPLDMATGEMRQYQKLPIEQKESYKWLRAAQKSKEVLSDAASITFIEDREGDIYEQLSSIASDNIHYIIRSKSNRITAGDTRAWDQLAEQPGLGSYTFTLPTDHRKDRKLRQITLHIRYTTITLLKERRSMKKAAAYPLSTTMNIVEAFEDRKGGISWKLLTTHAIKNFSDARQIVEWYSQRWYIEQMHRLLKHKGFQLEDSEMESGWAIRKLCIMMLSALLRIMQMNLAYNEPEGGQPINEVFTAEEIQCLKDLNPRTEGNTAKLQNHNDPMRLKWATWIIARIGGWTGYQSQGPPGVICMKRGLDKFAAIFFGWQVAKDVGTR